MGYLQLAEQRVDLERQGRARNRLTLNVQNGVQNFPGSWGKER